MTERRPSKLWLIYAGLIVSVIGLFALSLMIGRGGVWLSGADNVGSDVADIILFEVRLPRALLGLIGGAVLGACGAALQGLLRNPLAEPGLVGASSGAALGAVVVFYFGLFGGQLGNGCE